MEEDKLSRRSALPDNASLCAHQEHAVHKYIFPSFIVLNLILFIWSNCSMGAGVYVKVSGNLFGQHIQQTFETYSFSLINSVHTMWASRSYTLAILIAVMSGVWPYAKLLAMLALWFVPCEPRLRGRVLWWLEFLGKWSLIDMFVFTMMVVGFAVNLDAVAHVQVLVEPGFGIYSFTMAAMLSLLLSHFMSHLHRDVCETPALQSKWEGEEGSPVGLCATPLTPTQKQVRARYLAVAGLLVAAYALVFIGQVAPSFTIVYSGLVGDLLETRSAASFSLLANGLALPRSCYDKGAYFLMVIFLAIAFVAPLVELLLYAVLWLAPLKQRQQESARVVLDILGAWAGVDVFLVSIAATVFEIGKLSQQIIGQNCVLVDDLTGTHCFRVDAHLAWGAYLLLAGVLLSWGVQYIVWDVSAHAVSASASAAEGVHLLNEHEEVDSE